MLTNKQEIKFFAFLGGILFILLIISFVLSNRIQRGPVSAPAKFAAGAFDGIKITAKAAYVLDARTGEVLYAKNADARLPLASLTKVMTALVATELAPGYSTIVVSREAVTTDGDSGLTVGEKWSLKNLLDFSLTTSSNDGMRAVGLALGALSSSTSSPQAIESDFIKDMNKKADEIGMKDTYFLNDTGLDESPQKGGAYGSAKDIANLFAYILLHHPTLMSATGKAELQITSLDNAKHLARNTDLIINSLPGVIASKTGYTDLAGGNLALAFDPELGHPIVISVLGSTETGRFEDMLKLVSASERALQK
jgi:D-alanyl-D-alanine carboxypeptidase (penicillin-binding protein 5/6)